MKFGVYFSKKTGRIFLVEECTKGKFRSFYYSLSNEDFINESVHIDVVARFVRDHKWIFVGEA